MERRVCPICQKETTITSTDKIGKHPDSSGEPCQAWGLLFDSAKRKARFDQLSKRIEPLRGRIDAGEIRKLDNAMRDRDFRLVEHLLVVAGAKHE